MPIWYCMWRTHSIQVQEDHCVIVTLRFPSIWFFFLIYNIIDCVFCCDGAFLALHVKFRYLVSSLALWDCFYTQSVCLACLQMSKLCPNGGLCGFYLERLIFLFCQGVEFGTHLFLLQFLLRYCLAL